MSVQDLKNRIDSINEDVNSTMRIIRGAQRKIDEIFQAQLTMMLINEVAPGDLDLAAANFAHAKDKIEEIIADLVAGVELNIIYRERL